MHHTSMHNLMGVKGSSTLLPVSSLAQNEVTRINLFSMRMRAMDAMHVVIFIIPLRQLSSERVSLRLNQWKISNSNSLD